MNMLLSLDKIPRMHNILAPVFAWILLAGFVIAPGSFTGIKPRLEGGVDRFVLTYANTVAMGIGFSLLGIGTLGSVWLALRWRRNYVWLLNKLYLQLILNALAGMIATITGVYTQQLGEWSTQAYIAAIIEATILGLSSLLFYVYNYWLLQRIRSDHEETVRGGFEKRFKKRNKKKGGLSGLLARFRRLRRKPPIAAGSVV